MRNSFKNKNILITGGTGSFGKTFLNYILKKHHDIKNIYIFSRDEKKQFDLRNQITNPVVKFIIGDVRDYNSVLDAMQNIDYVFHAAALKQVPSCEFFPLEAVKTNILGTNNILTSANRTKVKKVVFLSTDKSVQPVNAMGMSKALMEKVIVAKSRNIRKDLTLCITRYGNVIGSRGSVIPTFIEQIKSNKNLTITDPSMTRFMMTLDEAVQLVMYAFDYGKNGDILVKKSPAASIDTIAKALLKYFKKKLSIKVIGTRQGEKKHEALLSKEEKVISENLSKFYKVNLINSKIDFTNFYSRGKKTQRVEEYRSDNTIQLDINQTINLIKKSGLI